MTPEQFVRKWGDAEADSVRAREIAAAAEPDRRSQAWLHAADLVRIDPAVAAGWTPCAPGLLDDKVIVRLFALRRRRTAAGR